MSEFLLAQQDTNESLWGESIQDSWGGHRVYSLWTTADIIRSLILVVELTGEEVTLQNLYNTIIDQCRKAEQKIIKIRESIKSYGDNQRSRDIRYLEGSSEASDSLQKLEEILRESQGYYGLPRSVMNVVGGETKPPPSGPTNLIASCLIYQALLRLHKVIDQRNGVQCPSPETHTKIKEFALYLARPECSLLRRATSEVNDLIAIQSEKQEHALEELRKAYERRRTQWPRAERLCQFPSIDADKAFVRNISGWVQRLTDNPGALWMDDQEHAGWTLVPFQPRAGIDPISTLVALQSLADSSEQFEGEERDRLLDAFEKGLKWLEGFISLGFKSPNWITAVKEDENLSQRWPLDLLSRFVLWLSGLLRDIPSAPSSEWSEFRSRLAVLKDIMYTSLLVRVFRVTVEEQSKPFEPVPVALFSGYEISHWPGVDTGFVAFALLSGRSGYEWERCGKEYRELSRYRSKIFEPHASSGGDLPIDLPLFASVIRMVKRQIVGSHNEEILKSKLELSNPSLQDAEVNLKGAFLASTGLMLGAPPTPSVYLWGTAHSLSAIVAWTKGVGKNGAEARSRELEANIRVLEADKRALANELDIHRVYSGLQMNRGLFVGTLCAIILGLFPWILMERETKQFSDIDVPLLWWIPVFLWFFWLLLILRTRAAQIVRWADVKPYESSLKMALLVPSISMLLGLGLCSGGAVLSFFLPAAMSAAQFLPTTSYGWVAPWTVISTWSFLILFLYLGYFLFGPKPAKKVLVKDNWLTLGRVMVQLLFCGFPWKPVSTDDLEHTKKLIEDFVD
ncbi:MAG: hypothetical protein K8G79_02115 [bacterium]|uniref:Uncharacterized protein n=1 Tax=Candidatus Methylomirabilis tolerans TaxID=3123416 RepID=A0AAJ1EI03_9BACT|nr:hypothetical protein [Candidatus Methylomirabilis sp.]